MALPANDPYEEAAPAIVNISAGVAYCSGTARRRWGGSNFCAFGHYFWKEVATGDINTPDRMWRMSYISSGKNITMLSGADSYVELFWANGTPGGNWDSWIKNPIWYNLQTPARIILGIAHWHCGIAEADIDVTSFNDTHTWLAAVGVFRSIAFVNESVIDHIKKLCEQSASVFIYENGALQLACGYISHAPGSTPDWELNYSNINKIIRYVEIRDRQIPGEINVFYDKECCPVGNPKFGLRKYQNPDVSYVDRELVMSGIYNAYYVDEGAGGSDRDLGAYTDFSEYMMLEVEVGGIGHCMDIDETVSVYEPILGLGIDSDYPENFRIHKIVLDPDRMTAILTMIKKKSWNAVP